MIAPWKLWRCVAALLAVLVAGCPRPPRPAPQPPPVAGEETPAPHEGVPYEIVAPGLVVIRVYRGGTLGGAGHNHVIAAHAIEGTIYVPPDVLRASFELRIAVADLTVDEAALRAEENSADFPPQVPQAAKDGTRRNMLSAALLDAEHNPQIVLRALRLEHAAEASGATSAGAVLARVQSSVAGRVRSFTLPVHYELSADTLIASGEAPLRQSDLGLTPFTALLGALQVQDEMRVKFRIVARRAAR